MGGPKGILVCSNKAREREFFCGLVNGRGCPAYASPSAIDALKHLQNEDIGVVLVDSELGDIDPKEFKSLVGKISPNVSTVIVSMGLDGNDDLKVNLDEFLKLVRDGIRTESKYCREVKDLKHFSYSLADRLLQIFEVNNRYFFNSDHLVSRLSGVIAGEMGLGESIVDAIRMAALLRDLGRVGIHHQLLSGSDRFRPGEVTSIREHPVHTVQILRKVDFPWEVDSIIGQHHEHYDGSGYPGALKGRQISIGARIIGVVDAYYAMVTDRPYRRAIPREDAVEEIKKNAGTQFDPEVVEVFLSALRNDPSVAYIKRKVLIYEREHNIAALVKLCAVDEEMEIVHVISSIEAVRYIEKHNPDLVIADADALTPEEFNSFYDFASYTLSPEKSILLIVPDDDYPRRFLDKVDYVKKPLTIETLSQKITDVFSGKRWPRQAEEVRGLSGAIEDFSLPDILQILGLGLKTALVEVTRDEQKGTIYMLSGKVVHASLGELRGQEAFFELISWKYGKFFIMHGRTTSDVNIRKNTMHLLLEASTRMDEMKPHGTQPKGIAARPGLN